MSSRSATFLDKAFAEVDLEGARVERPRFSYDNTRRLELSNGQALDFFFAYSWSDELSVRIGSAKISSDEIAGAAVLLRIAARVSQRYLDLVAEDKAAQVERQRIRDEQYRRERAQREEEARKAREEKDALDAERRERLLTEFQGEHVRVRVKGYRSTVRAVVEAQEIRRWNDEGHREATGEYEPILKYDEGLYDWPKTVSSIERFEVKVGSRYRLVWEDDPERAGYMNPKRNTKKTYDGEIFGEEQHA